MNKMNMDNKTNLIQLYKQRTKIFKKLDNHKSVANLKKSFIKAKTNFISDSYNLPELNDTSKENSKINICERNTPLILPSIPNMSIINKSSLNSSFNKDFPYECLLKAERKNKLKLRKIKIIYNNKNSKSPMNKNKSLINLYNENILLKKRLERFKGKNREDMGNFSFKKYNFNLIKLSSMNLSLDSCNSFRKNMEEIEEGLNGYKKRKNRWLIFLDKIEKIAPEKIKKKLKSLSEHKCPELDEHKS